LVCSILTYQQICIVQFPIQLILSIGFVKFASDEMHLGRLC